MWVGRASIDDFHRPGHKYRSQRGGWTPHAYYEKGYDYDAFRDVTLKPQLPDLTDEEWTPKDAGSAKRIDFVSPATRLCIEAKKTRDRDHPREIIKELKEDIESYYVHDACDTLIAFIYDPDGYMSDARQVEAQKSNLREVDERLRDAIARLEAPEPGPAVAPALDSLHWARRLNQVAMVGANLLLTTSFHTAGQPAHPLRDVLREELGLHEQLWRPRAAHQRRGLLDGHVPLLHAAARRRRAPVGS